MIAITASGKMRLIGWPEGLVTGVDGPESLGPVGVELESHCNSPFAKNVG